MMSGCGAAASSSISAQAREGLGGEARDRVAGFWRALGFTPPVESDHLGALLGLYAALADAEAGADAAGQPARALLRRASRAALLWEHLLSWLPAWLDAVEAIARPWYASWARLLRAALDIEAAEHPVPPALPLALREAPGLPADDAPAVDWIAAILAPVRSGVILTRTHVARAAAALGVGVRAGERAFMLRSLFEQDPAGVADWIVAEAGASAARHADGVTTHGPVAVFWQARAEACARALSRMRPGQGLSTPDSVDTRRSRSSSR